MSDNPTSLDEHRGMKAQQATELRRRRLEVEADQAALRSRRDAFEKLLLDDPAGGWPETVEKARYLLGILGETSAADQPRRRVLIDRVLADFSRLLDSPSNDHPVS